MVNTIVCALGAAAVRVLASCLLPSWVVLGCDAEQGKKGGAVDPVILQEYQLKLAKWLGQGYRLLADDVDGTLRITVHYVSHNGAVGSEREQEYWPMAPEIVQMLKQNGIEISRALAGPRPWSGGPTPDELE